MYQDKHNLTTSQEMIIKILQNLSRHSLKSSPSEIE